MYDINNLLITGSKLTMSCGAHMWSSSVTSSHVSNIRENKATYTSAHVQFQGMHEQKTMVNLLSNIGQYPWTFSHVYERILSIQGQVLSQTV